MPTTSPSHCAWLLGFAVAAMSGAGCSRAATLPDPAAAVDAYAEAVRRGDADAIYGMMSTASTRALSRQQVAAVLASQKRELSDHARALVGPGRAITAQAELRYADGEIVALDLQDGRFLVTTADALPAASKTPEQALTQLRRALARRSYAGLVRLLSPRLRAVLERDLRSLVEGLMDPAALGVEVVGDEATVVVPGGHQIKLRRREGVWQVDDLD